MHLFCVEIKFSNAHFSLVAFIKGNFFATFFLVRIINVYIAQPLVIYLTKRDLTIFLFFFGFKIHFHLFNQLFRLIKFVDFQIY